MNILTLSGGGFKGLYTAKVLERLEEELKVPIAQKFRDIYRWNRSISSCI